MAKFEGWVNITRKYFVNVEADSAEDVYELLTNDLLPCDIEDRWRKAAETEAEATIYMEAIDTEVEVSDPDAMQQLPDDAPVAFKVDYEQEGAAQ